MKNVIKIAVTLFSILLVGCAAESDIETSVIGTPVFEERLPSYIGPNLPQLVIVGTFTASIVNDGVNADEIDSLILAGEYAYAAEIKLKAIGESVYTEDLTICTPGDKSSTLKNVEIISDGNVIVGAPFIVFDGTNTSITFTDGFTTSGEVNALIAVDLNKFTTSSGEISATLGSMTFEICSPIEAVGESSNAEIEVDLSNSEVSDPVSIVPVLMTLAVEDEFGDNDDSARVRITLDYGDNNFDGQDLYAYAMILSSPADVTVTNDDGDKLLDSTGLYIDYAYAAEVDNSLYDSLVLKQDGEYEFSLNETGGMIIKEFNVWLDINEDGNVQENELFNAYNGDGLNLNNFVID